jgi:hypothetical protein
MYWEQLGENPLNLGMNGLGTFEQYLLLREYVKNQGMRPKVIVLQFFEGNDFPDNWQFFTLATDSTDYDPNISLDEYFPTQNTRGDLENPLDLLYITHMMRYVSGSGTLNVIENPEFSFEVSIPGVNDGIVEVYDGYSFHGVAYDSRAGAGKGIGIEDIKVYSGDSCDVPENDILLWKGPIYRPDLVDFLNLDTSYQLMGFWTRVEFPQLGVQNATICAESAIDGSVQSETRTVDVIECPFPLIDENDFPITPARGYTSLLTISREEYEQSGSYQMTRDGLRQVKEMADELGIPLVVAYVPTKTHVHLDLLTDEQLLRGASSGDTLFTYNIDNNAMFFNFVENHDTPPEEFVERLRANADVQRDLVQEIAADYGIRLVDLTPIFEERVAAGENLYWRADTHLAPNGQNLLGEILDTYLQDEGILP